MEINLGFACSSTILKDCSPSKTVTVANLDKIPSERAKTYKLLSLTKQNLDNLRRLFYHCVANDIKLFRLSTGIVPLASTFDWSFEQLCKTQFDNLSTIITEENLIVSVHASRFVHIASPDQEVRALSLSELTYLDRLLTALQVSSEWGKIVMHATGNNADKEGASKQFLAYFERLPDNIKRRIVLENDDRIFGTTDILNLCKTLEIPMVLDVLHHHCTSEEPIFGYIDDVFSTWNTQKLPPKLHYSTLKGPKCARAHAEYVNIDEFRDFYHEMSKFNVDFNIMIEAKARDKALLQLRAEI